MQGLKGSYPSVRKAGSCSYGGNQSWSYSAAMRKSGCGVIAATDLLFYLHRNRKGCQTEVFFRILEGGTISLAAYNRLAEGMRRKYFPIIPQLGTNGLGVAAGLNCYFRKYHLPLRARWAVWGKDVWNEVEQMLADDLPVILAIGQNVPFFWTNHKLRLYVKQKEGIYQSSGAVKAHYVTITGIEPRWVRVSSWGREYYINREEFDRYVKKYSSYLISNIVSLRQKA